MKNVFVLMLALLAALAASPADELTITPNPAAVTPGGTVQFAATGTTGAPGAVAWQIIPAGLGTIDGAGVFTASSRPGQGIVRAVAAAADGKESVGHAYLRVNAGAVHRLSVSVSPARAVVSTGAAGVTGGTVTFTARVFDARNTEISGAEISWKVVPADLGSIDPNGIFTTRNPGPGRIVAVARTPDAKGLGQARLSVVTAERPHRLAVAISPKRARIAPGGTAVFTAAVSDQDGRPVEATLRFTVEPPSLGTIDASGTFTAGVKPGTGIVRVIATSDKAVGSDRALVTVGAQARRWVVRLTPRQAVLHSGETVQLSAEAFDQDGNQVLPPSWVWKVIPERLGTITPDGLFTSGNRAMAGRIAVQLPPEYGQGGDASAVRIKPGRPNQVRIDPPKALVRPGETQQFTAAVTGPDGALRNDARVEWKAYPPGTGTITPSGLFTAGPSPRLGSVIALVSPDQGGGKGIAGIVVSSYYVRINGTRPRYLARGEVYQFTAEVRDAGGNPVSGVSFEWSRSSLSTSFGVIDPATGIFTAGQPLAAQVEGMVYVRALLNGQMIGGDGIKVFVHR